MSKCLESMINSGGIPDKLIGWTYRRDFKLDDSRIEDKMTQNSIIKDEDTKWFLRLIKSPAFAA